MTAIDETVIGDIVADYQHGRGPFAGEELPINRAVRELKFENDREKALYITLDGSLNRVRDADRLRENTTKLWKQHRWAFEPEELCDRGFAALESVFTSEEYSFRFQGQDAENWYRNAYTLDREYGGDPLTLFEAFEHDAVAIKREASRARYDEEVQPEFTHLTNNKKFAGLGGDKVGALWLQNIHMLVTHLDNIQEVATDADAVPPTPEGDDLVPIPVDRHIAKVTSALTGRQLSAEDDRERIRRLWDEFFAATDFDALEVDKPLWVLGRPRVWNDGGCEYLKRKLNERA